MKKLNSLYWALIMFFCIIHSPLYAMKSSQVAVSKHRYCFAQLREAFKHQSHRYCMQSLCPRLITALEVGDFEIFSAHLTSENSNLSIIDPIPGFPSFNLLEFALRQHTPISFKIACIQLFIDRGFSQPILEPILKKNNCELLQAFLELPAAQTSFICAATLPLEIYNWWNMGLIIDNIALSITKYYSTNAQIPADLRDKFNVIKRIIQHGSIRYAICRKDVQLIIETQKHLPILLAERLRYNDRAVSITEYIRLSHKDDRLTETAYKQDTRKTMQDLI
jgi:hypothetical protein